MAGRKDSEADTRADTETDTRADTRDETGSRAKVAEFAAAGRRKGCPICGRPVAKETRPFCSKRCADIDLASWFRGEYRVPSEEPPDAEEPPSDG